MNSTGISTRKARGDSTYTTREGRKLRLPQFRFRLKTDEHFARIATGETNRSDAKFGIRELRTYSVPLAFFKEHFNPGDFNHKGRTSLCLHEHGTTELSLSHVIEYLTQQTRHHSLTWHDGSPKVRDLQIWRGRAVVTRCEHEHSPNGEYRVYIEGFDGHIAYTRHLPTNDPRSVKLFYKDPKTKRELRALLREEPDLEKSALQKHRHIPSPFAYPKLDQLLTLLNTDNGIRMKILARLVTDRIDLTLDISDELKITFHLSTSGISYSTDSFSADESFSGWSRNSTDREEIYRILRIKGIKDAKMLRWIKSELSQK